MREIKFRGKRVDTGDWIFGSLIIYRSGKTMIVENRHERIYEVIPETIGQFTGLKDKNGVDIYEGDISKTPEDWGVYKFQAGEVNEVYFAYGGFRLKPKSKNAKGYWIEDGNDCEVIGNIHD